VCPKSFKAGILATSPPAEAIAPTAEAAVVEITASSFVNGSTGRISLKTPMETSAAKIQPPFEFF
jgi:hypothetical protein